MTVKKLIKLKNNKDYLYFVLYAIVLAVTLFPLSCDYIPEGELSWSLDGLMANAENFDNIMVSYRLWTMLSKLMYSLSGGIVTAWRISMLIIQTGTLFLAGLFSEKLFENKENEGSFNGTAFFCVLLYMTCPYRIYLCYDSLDMGQAVVWMLMPLYGWMILKIFSDTDAFVENIITAGIVLSVIGYVDVISLIIISWITVTVAIYSKNVKIFLSVPAAWIFCAPETVKIAAYLFTGKYDYVVDIQINSIMNSGYRLTEYFTSYAWRNGHPGMGMGMLICLLVMLWLWYVKGRKTENKAVKYFSFFAFLCAVMAFYRFPWDVIERLGAWSLKLISMIGTPAVFAGISYAALSVTGAYAIHSFEECEGEKAAYALKVIILTVCLGLCIYQCNMLTYI
jgi:hypothetical protein